MKKNEVKIGMKVTCVKKEEAYYSKYAGNPECFFECGDVGTVGAIDVPYVTTPSGKNKSFVCVDFDKMGKRWRAGVDYDNIVRCDLPICPKRKYAIRVSEMDLKKEVIEQIKKLDPNCVIDPEGNPITFWVETQLSEKQIESLKGISFYAISNS